MRRQGSLCTVCGRVCASASGQGPTCADTKQRAEQRHRWTTMSEICLMTNALAPILDLRLFLFNSLRVKNQKLS